MNYQGLQTYSRQLAWEVINNYPADFERHEAIHEQVDGSGLVIYYRKSWEVVNTVRRCDGLLMDRAEEMREEYDMVSDNVDTIMCQLTYCILYIMTTEAVEELSPCTA